MAFCSKLPGKMLQIMEASHGGLQMAVGSAPDAAGVLAAPKKNCTLHRGERGLGQLMLLPFCPQSCHVGAAFPLARDQDGWRASWGWDNPTQEEQSLIFPLSSSLSGDGFYYNDDLTKRPPAAKYRPDQFRGYNTGSATQLGWVHKEGNIPRE